MTKLLRSTGRLWLLFATLLTAQGAWAQVVISQVYGGGGNSGSIYTNDFIELFNRGTTAVDVTGWTVQYASSAGTFWATTTLSGTIPPGHYYLVQEAAGTTPGTALNLPSPDATGTINMSGTAGKVALVNTTIALSGSCPAGSSALDYGTIQDFVGFGTTANCFRGTGPTPAPSNTTAVLRGSNGCADTQQNATDFTAGAPNPRNSSSPTNRCYSTTPTLSANPTSLTGFVATQGMVSNVQTYTLTGRTASGNPVYVDATTNIEMSTTPNGQFSPGLALGTTTGTDIISNIIYVRLTKTAPAGPISGTITNTSNSEAPSPIVLVSGTVNGPNTPSLSASPTTLSSFSTSQGTVSAEKNYTLTATSLAAGITVAAPAGVEVSQTSGSGFGSSLTLPMSTTAAVVYVHLTGSGAAGNVSGTITNIAGSLTANVAVSGTISSTAPVAFTPIATARAGINSTFTVAGRVTVSNQLGARQIYIQDATGGIAVYSGPSGPDFTTLVNIGDSVQVRGPVTVFSGYLELTGSGNFTVVTGAGSRVPTPVAITPGQLASYQGQLVSIANATITPVAGSFSGGTSYTITAGGQANTLRISANSPLSGAGQPANPVSVTGIADRFVSGATTTGNDALQLQPRILADIPGSTAATDLTCTVGSGSPLTRDQTLDIAAWNMEFFGAGAGTIVCPVQSTTLVYNNMGPANDDLQKTNAITVLSKLTADIISTEEVSDINRFAAAVAAIPGSYSYVCSDKFSYFFQDECTQTPSGNPPTVFGPTSLAQKVCVIYNTATVTPVLAETKALLYQKTADYTYPNGSGWASGRLPFLFVANVTINGVTRKIHVVAVHGKSGSAAADFNRRVQDYNDLKAELDTNYPTANIIILGDYNDRATSSIYTSSPVSSFNSFVTDVANYSVITKPLEQNGCVTYNPSGGSFIDQMTISDDLQKGYLANTAYVLQPYSIANYGNTTSDHSPIEARFDISQLAGPATALNLTVSASPTTLLTTGTTTLSATVSGGTMPYSYTFSGPGTITPSGNTASVSNLPAGVQTFTVVARDATMPASQTISATVSVMVSTTSTGPATLTITSVNCFSTNGALSSVNFVVGYSNGTFTPALPNLFINGVTASGQLGQTYSFGFDANAMPVPIQDNATRSTYFVWNFRQACAGPVTPPVLMAPMAPSLPNQTAIQGSFFSYGVPTFSGTTPISYTATGLPTGLSFNSTSRTISGTPSLTAYLRWLSRPVMQRVRAVVNSPSP